LCSRDAGAGADVGISFDIRGSGCRWPPDRDVGPDAALAEITQETPGESVDPPGAGGADVVSCLLAGLEIGQCGLQEGLHVVSDGEQGGGDCREVVLAEQKRNGAKTAKGGVIGHSTVRSWGALSLGRARVLLVARLDPLVVAVAPVEERFEERVIGELVSGSEATCAVLDSVEITHHEVGEGGFHRCKAPGVDAALHEGVGAGRVAAEVARGSSNETVEGEFGCWGGVAGRGLERVRGLREPVACQLYPIPCRIVAAASFAAFVGIVEEVEAGGDKCVAVAEQVVVEVGAELGCIVGQHAASPDHRLRLTTREQSLAELRLGRLLEAGGHVNGVTCHRREPSRKCRG
jgi:hypothetical protein